MADYSSFGVWFGIFACFVSCGGIYYCLWVWHKTGKCPTRWLVLQGIFLASNSFCLGVSIFAVRARSELNAQFERTIAEPAPSRADLDNPLQM